MLMQHFCEQGFYNSFPDAAEQTGFGNAAGVHARKADNPIGGKIGSTLDKRPGTCYNTIGN